MSMHDLPVAADQGAPTDGRAGMRTLHEGDDSLLIRIKNLLLSRDIRQQIRLAQAGLANLLMLACVGMLHWLDAAGATNHPYVWPWTLSAVGGMVAVFALIRSGRVMHWRDPSLTLQQMLYAILCSALAYCITGSARATVIPILAVVLMFGMFGMTLRQVTIVGIFTLMCFGAAGAYWMEHPHPSDAPGVEVAHLMIITIMVAGVVLLTGRLHGMRERSRRQKAALSTALERIRELATRDELTGCFNRRAMLERMAEESLRCVRNSTSMCLVLLDLDHFKRINDVHGHAAGDLVLRGFAEAARSQLRATDVLGRWGGEEFLLMLPVCDIDHARQCVTRVLNRLSSSRFEVGEGATLMATCSAGVTQCDGGESIVAAIERADKALYRAKAEGRNRLICG
ncbi:sensor domain-containing diguanylate cyclase [Albitalea terrae]|uniref:diguanylate cyclase n=2 Tax=Piscinibacter terrae TaxID=2496871 RepID=A0A3N7JRM3_9BURK|nr:sensor domain-containing diguanylate cyclase [Albitalea terrae]